MSFKESGRRSPFVCKYRKNPSLKHISLERMLRLPTSITFAQNFIGAILEFFGKASRMFLTNLAASNNDMSEPLKRALAEIISLSMVFRIPVSTLKIQNTLEIFDNYTNKRTLILANILFYLRT